MYSINGVRLADDELSFLNTDWYTTPTPDWFAAEGLFMLDVQSVDDIDMDCCFAYLMGGKVDAISGQSLEKDGVALIRTGDDWKEAFRVMETDVPNVLFPAKETSRYIFESIRLTFVFEVERIQYILLNYPVENDGSTLSRCKSGTLF